MTNDPLTPDAECTARASKVLPQPGGPVIVNGSVDLAKASARSRGTVNEGCAPTISADRSPIDSKAAAIRSRCGGSGK